MQNPVASTTPAKAQSAQKTLRHRSTVAGAQKQPSANCPAALQRQRNGFPTKTPAAIASCRMHEETTPRTLAPNSTHKKKAAAGMTNIKRNSATEFNKRLMLASIHRSQPAA
mmetsp:Transcript_67028/g.119257  ORF Transcript_67028/g.119257 Transcript_67028/m.119257 type:complete len:112 (-) Transcript_67028:1220-1555(-)